MLDNRQIITDVMDALSRGETQPFADAMADDLIWHMHGTTAWSGTFRGKADVRGRLMKALFEQYATPYTSMVSRIHADGDFVVVEYKGDVTTRRGMPYKNTYCFVIRMKDGKMSELTEYMDTALVDAVLEPPQWS